MGATASLSVVSVGGNGGRDAGNDDSDDEGVISRSLTRPGFGSPGFSRASPASAAAASGTVRTFVITSFGPGISIAQFESHSGPGMRSPGASSFGIGGGPSTHARNAWVPRPPSGSEGLHRGRDANRPRIRGHGDDDEDGIDADSDELNIISQVNRLTLQHLMSPMMGSPFLGQSIWDTLPFNLVLFIPREPDFQPQGLTQSKLDELEHKHSRSLQEHNIALLESGDDECVICHETYKKGDRVTNLPSCSHFFHVDCIRPWLERTDTCPLCRCKVTL